MKAPLRCIEYTRPVQSNLARWRFLAANTKTAITVINNGAVQVSSRLIFIRRGESRRFFRVADIPKED
jgi:hypothetical protein